MPWPNLFAFDLSWLAATVFFAGFEYLLPEMTRAGVLFAVTVDPELRQTREGATIVAGYRRIILFFALVSILVVLVRPLGSESGPLAFAVQYAGFLAATLRARRQTLPYAVASPSRRQASLELHEPPAALAVLASAPAVAVLAAALWIPSHWEQLPDPTPVHWMLDGQPDAWVARTPLHVYGMLGLLGGIVGVFAITSCGMLFWSRRLARSGRTAGKVPTASVGLVLLIAGEYLLGAVALMPLGLASLRSGFAVFVAVAVCSLYLAVAGHAGTAIEDEARAAHDGTPDQAWKLGLFYFNRDDPAFFVEKRFGLGWTVNFGHRFAWLLIGSALIPMAVGVAFVCSA